MSESTQQQIEYLQQLQHVFSPFLVQEQPPPPPPLSSAPSFTSIFTNILQTYQAHQQRRSSGQGSLLFNTLLTISEQLLQTHLSAPEESHELVTILLCDLEPGNDEHELYRNYKDCSICFEPIQTSITITPCKHGYHEECIKKWLRQHPSCPICRHEC